MFRHRVTVLVVAVAFLLFVLGIRSGWTYTQSGIGVGFGNAVPMGHEWVTRMAAIELLGYLPPTVPDKPDPNDPRKGWTQGLAKNLNLSGPGAQAEVQRIKSLPFNDQAYAPRYKPVYDAIVGERWVDIGGYNIGPSRYLWSVNCWDAVAQEPAEVQYDHFMRRYDDVSGEGGATAAEKSRQRFIAYFVAAAMAPPAIMSVYDGGAAGSTAVDVDRNYFLFGRAVHLFQDSFSSEHTVRIPADNYTRVRQVKSYLCAPGSEQHTHVDKAIFDYSSGDVVWIPGTKLDPTWNSYKASFMKTSALVATEATKDLWAAFIRTMGTPMAQREAVARAEATTLANNWLSSDQQETTTWYNDESHRGDSYVLASGQTGKGQTVKQCMAGISDAKGKDQQSYVKELMDSQRKCVYNAVPWPGYQDLYDPSMHMWFSWKWRNPLKLEDPPPSWQIPNFPADSGVHVRIGSVAKQGLYLSAPDGIKADAWVYVKPNTTALDFILVGSKENGVFRVANAPLLFLSYRGYDGAVKLWQPGILEPSNYKMAPAGPGWSIMSIPWGPKLGYMNYDGKYQSPYINHNGNPANPNSQWYIEGLPR